MILYSEILSRKFTLAYIGFLILPICLFIISFVVQFLKHYLKCKNFSIFDSENETGNQTPEIEMATKNSKNPRKGDNPLDAEAIKEIK